MTTRARSNEYRLTTVCVDSYENGVFSGRIYNPYLETGKEFRSLIQFLSELEQTLDAMDFPKSFTATRTFAASPKWEMGSTEAGGKTGELATFAVRIFFRQNASWQGSVSWLEGGKEQSFRSALELIFLMDSALKSGRTGRIKQA